MVREQHPNTLRSETYGADARGVPWSSLRLTFLHISVRVIGSSNRM